MNTSEYIENVISNDNTQKVKYIILFFVFFIALSQNTFKNLFGCNLNDYLRNIYLKHLISILFLFLLFDLNLNPQQKSSGFLTNNPFVTFIYTILVYILVFLLLHCNKVYVLFIVMIIIFLIVLDRTKQYYEHKITDQEVLQERLSFLYKMNNVFVIIIILTIIIGTLSSLDVKSLFRTLYQNGNQCR